MLTLAYKLSSDWARPAREIDLANADETTLRYDAFPGDVTFEVGGADFSARWGWVPVLDFALALRAVAGALVSTDREQLGFTESDAEIDFRRQGDVIRVEADYAPGTGEVPLVDLSLESERFLARMITELTASYPPLGENTFVRELSRELAV
jgi:hypothetical protein